MPTPPFSQDRLVRKEVALGLIREFELPQDHIGLSLIAPFKNVESDDVIFEYAQGLVAGLAPARAEDAESELASKDASFGHGRASVIDWAIKDHYDPSDVSRYREAIYLNGTIGTNLPLTVNNITEGFQEKVARDAKIRRRKLDNRLEYLIMKALESSVITYDDGKIKFSVDYGRPAGQSINTSTDVGYSEYWDNAAADPIADIIAMKELMFDTYGVHMTRGICSQKVINKILTSTKFTNDLIGSNPLYTVRGWGIEAAKQVVQEATDVELIVYNSVYRTKPIGSNTVTNNFFLSRNKIVFLPSVEDVAALDDTVGFAATLTSPHVEGNWSPGYYEWEQETVDPWGRDVGTGIKAFPVFPHMNLSFVMQVLATLSDTTQPY